MPRAVPSRVDFESCCLSDLRQRASSHEVADFVRSHKRVYVVEQNRDEQMFSLLRIDLDNELVAKLRSVARLDGLPIDARSVTDEIAAMEEK